MSKIESKRLLENRDLSVNFEVFEKGKVKEETHLKFKALTLGEKG